MAESFFKRHPLRFHEDDRGVRYNDIFPVGQGDVNCTLVYPGALSAWHRHRLQDDYQICVRGALKFGFCDRPAAEGGRVEWVYSSERSAGDGSYIRNWLHAGDTAAAILHIVDHGERNRVYNIAGDVECSNREVIEQVLVHFFGRQVPLEDHVQFNYVRMGEDVRYSLDDSALRGLGWKNSRSFDRELRAIVEHYKNSFTW